MRADRATADRRRAARRRPALLAALAASVGMVLVAGLGCGGDEPSGDAGGRGSERARGALPEDGDAERRRLRPLRGGARLVFFGDSLATAGARPYPARISATAGGRLEVANVSDPGTTSADWLPGSTRFERRLLPELAGADLVLLTVGGNDLERALGGADGFDALARARDPEIARRLQPALRRIGRNLARSFAAIRRANPRIAIAYVSYPDYSATERWRRSAGRLGTLALRAGLAELLAAARAADPDLLIDMRAATASDPDRLISGEYLTASGHALYAREIVRRIR